jgi:hypothetical protein
MPDLIITLQEQYTTPGNSNAQIISNAVTIPNINQFVRRVDSINSLAPVGIASFVTSNFNRTPGSFISADVKYVRITNLSTSNSSAIIYLIKNNTDSVTLSIDVGKSLILSNTNFNTSNTAYDYVVEGYVDPQYFEDFSTLDQIQAKASSGNVYLEYIIASI